MSSFWLNGHIVKKERAKLSLLDHGLLYGDGVFEGIRFYNGRCFMLSEHMQRLFDSAKAIMLDIPYSISDLNLAATNLIHASQLTDGYIRLVITRGEGKLGIDPRGCQANVFMIADQLCVRENSNVTAVTASIRRIPNQCWDQRIKSLNYLNNVLAKLEAIQAGAHEAILLNQQGNIAEGSINNIFIYRENCLYTPPVWDGALQGITRGIILQLAQRLKICCKEQSLTPYDVYTAKECFLCGTGYELVSLDSLDGRKLPQSPGPIFLQIKQAFQNYIQQQTGTQEVSC